MNRTSPSVTRSTAPGVGAQRVGTGAARRTATAPLLQRTVVFGVALMLVGLFVGLPFVRAFQYSLTEWNGFTDSTFVGVDNYVRLLTEDTAFQESLWHAALLTLVFVVQSVCVPLLAAYLVHHLRSRRGKRISTVLIMIPSVAPVVATLLLWSSFLQPDGLVNRLLGGLGLEFLQANWLGDSGSVLVALMLVGFPWLNGLNTLILLSGFLSIDLQLYEAAAIDGARRPRVFRHIELPTLRPQLGLLALIAVIVSLQNYENVFLLTGGGPGSSSTVPGMELYNNAFRYSDFGYASAIGVFLFLTIVLITGLSQGATRLLGRRRHE